MQIAVSPRRLSIFVRAADDTISMKALGTVIRSESPPKKNPTELSQSTMFGQFSAESKAAAEEDLVVQEKGLNERG